ncbi:MAG: DUF973 family protein [Candidatus Micrarchaeaceae archaeon]
MANEGISKIRKALLLFLLGYIINFIVAIFGTGSLLSPGGAQRVASGGMAIELVNIIGAFGLLVAFFWIRGGFKKLSEKKPKLKIGSIGALLELIGLGITIIANVVLAVELLTAPQSAASPSLMIGAVAVATFVISFFGLIIYIIGDILCTIAFWRVGSENKSSLIKAGAVFYFLFPLVGGPLLYKGLEEVEEK